MDSDDEREDVPSWRGVPGIVILINVYDPSGNNTAAVALAATCRMVRQRLRSSSAHFLGVCLYGVDDDSNSSAFAIKSVVDIIPLSTPNLTDYVKLRDIDVSTYKQTKEFRLSEVLLHASKLFAYCKKQLSSRTVVLMTRLETPPVVLDQDLTFQKVADLVDSNIDIQIINIAQDEYQIDSFYTKFLIDAKGRDFVMPQPIWNDKEIERVLQQQSHRHLAVARLSLEIGNGMSIGVGVYNLLNRSQQYHKKVNLDRDSNAIVSTVTKTVKVSRETSEPGVGFGEPMDTEESMHKQMPLLKSELLHYQEYGGERVEFTDNELKKIRNPFGSPMIKLLGFKPASVMCKEKWFLKTGYFLFPNESIIEGSTIAFKALHQACVDTSTVGICVLCTRVNARPIIAALSPCSHPLGLDVEIGFNVIPIPFKENVRDIPVPEEDGETMTRDTHKIFMKDMLKSIKFDYKPDMFESPKVQSTYRAIEAIALDEDNPDPFIDTTKPPPEKFNNIQEDMFEELFGPFGPVAPKRVATSKEPGGASKKPKKDIGIDDTAVKDRIKYETVDQYTVSQLKDVLKRKGDPDMPSLVGLKKAQLCEMVYKYYG